MSSGPYVTMTMCHCDDPDDDHWAVGIPVHGYRESTGYVTVADDMTEGFHTREEAQMFADAKNRRTSV